MLYNNASIRMCSECLHLVSHLLGAVPSAASVRTLLGSDHQLQHSTVQRERRPLRFREGQRHRLERVAAWRQYRVGIERQLADAGVLHCRSALLQQCSHQPGPLQRDEPRLPARVPPHVQLRDLAQKDVRTVCDGGRIAWAQLDTLRVCISFAAVHAWEPSSGHKTARALIFFSTSL